MKKNNVIITFSDAKYGDFLIENWLESLRANVNLQDIDIAVLDYGLSKTQVSRLKNSGVKVVKCNRDGHIVAIRFRDISKFLKKTKYNHVMACDGGDIIFQTDISKIFKKDVGQIKAVYEHYPPRFNELTAFQQSVDKKLMDEIRRCALDKKMINAGMLIGPRKKFIQLCDFCYENIKDKKKFGPDQVVINYFLHKNSFSPLSSGYNFITYTAKEPFKIRNGQFFYKNGGLIPIVHNAGRISFVRAIENFGYGEKHNRLKFIKFYLFRAGFRLLHRIYK